MWSGVRFNASDSSIHLTWTKPPSVFIGVSSVKKYLILYNSNPANPVRTVYSALWLPADKTHVTISGLLPFTNYSLIVVAILTDESKRGNTGWRGEQTEEGGKSHKSFIMFVFFYHVRKIKRLLLVDLP